MDNTHGYPVILSVGSSSLKGSSRRDGCTGGAEANNGCCIGWASRPITGQQAVRLYGFYMFLKMGVPTNCQKTSTPFLIINQPFCGFPILRNIHIITTTPSRKASCHQQTLGDTGGKLLGMPWVPLGDSLSSALPPTWGASDGGSYGERIMLHHDQQRASCQLGLMIYRIYWVSCRSGTPICPQSLGVVMKTLNPFLDVPWAPSLALTHAVKKAAVTQLLSIEYRVYRYPWKYSQTSYKTYSKTIHHYLFMPVHLCYDLKHCQL